jgi:tetraacyldisaccharide 4'-kinase
MRASPLAGLFILDDCFQHLALGRHLDLVLLTPEDLGRDWDRVFPVGRWRESRRALARASAFLVKAPAAEFAAARERIEARLGAYGRPVFQFDLHISGLTALSGEPAA